MREQLWFVKYSYGETGEQLWFVKYTLGETREHLWFVKCTYGETREQLWFVKYYGSYGGETSNIRTDENNYGS